MSGYPEIIVFGSKEATSDTALSIPVTQSKFDNGEDLKKYVAGLSNLASFIVVSLNSTEEDLNSVVAGFTEEKKPINILICGNKKSQLLNNQTNCLYISKSLILHEVVYSIVKFLKLRLQKLRNNGATTLVRSLTQQIETVKGWLNLYNRIRSCHILLIPVNTTEDLLFETQDRLQLICDRLLGNRFKARVFTIYDYVRSNALNHDQTEDMSYFEYRQISSIHDLVAKFGGIRMYVVGNELSNSVDSTKLIANEKDTAHPNIEKYVERCTFIYNEDHGPIDRKVTRDHLPKFEWQMAKNNRTPRPLSEIENDPDFEKALLSVHGTDEARQTAANNEFHQAAKYLFENCIKIHEPYHRSESVEDCPLGECEDVGEAINIKIQSSNEQ